MPFIGINLGGDLNLDSEDHREVRNFKSSELELAKEIVVLCKQLFTLEYG
jgi:hypothetical protein